MEANVVRGAVSLARVDELPNGVRVLIVAHGVNDYAGYLDAPAALEYAGAVHGKSGWDSDRGQVFYRSDARTARVYQPVKRFLD